MLKIDGVLKLLTPMNVADPVTYRLGDDGKIIWNDPKAGKPYTRTVRFTLLPSGQNGNGAEDDEKNHPEKYALPYFPANDVRGRLRRKACGIVFDHLRGNGVETLSLDAYSGMMCGASTGNPAEGQVSLEYLRSASQNLFMGIFGGGPRLVRSAYTTFDLVPICDRTIGAGIVPERLRDHANPGQSLRDFTYIVQSIRINDAMRFIDPRAEKIITNYAETITALQKKLFGEKTKRKSDAENPESGKPDKNEKSKRSETAMMMAREVIAPGTSLYFRLGLSDRLSDAQVGLVFESVAQLMNDQGFGCRVSDGMGYFLPMLTLHDGDTRIPLFRDGVQDMHYELSGEEPVTRRLEALAAELSKVKATDIEHLFQVAA